MKAVFSNIFYKLLDLIFPKEDSVIFLEKLAENDSMRELPECSEELPKNHFAIFSYKNRYVRNLIWEIKYRRNQKLIDAVAKLLYEEILEHLGDKDLFYSPETILIPIPISKNRLKDRGFNQTELIVKAIERLDTQKELLYGNKILQKSTDTISQTKTKNKKDRMKNIVGSFSLNEIEKTKIEDKNIIIIDDVITTGATMMEAMRIIKSLGTKNIFCIAIAH